MSRLKQFVRSIMLFTALAGIITVFAANDISAREFGITGLSQGGCGGGFCHGGQSGATTVALVGPRDVAPGAVVNYTFTVAHATNNYAGFNVSMVTAGGAPAGTLGAGANSHAENNQLTHNQATADGAGGAAEFPFTWTAPVEHGVYTFYGAGNAVNDNGNADGGDVFNLTGGIAITVKGVTITAPGGGTYCRSTNLTINWTQTGFQNFKIELSSNNFANSEVLTNSVAATANTFTWAIPANQEVSTGYMVRFINTADGQEVKRSNAFTIKGPPTITTQPQSQLVCEGRTLQLTVGSDLGTATYQWRKDGVLIPGATNAAYQVGVAQPTDAGSYDVQVFGCNGSSTSNAAVVTIGLRPKITLQPVGKTVCENDSASLFADGEGSGATYQWYRNGEIMPGKTTKTLRFASILLTDEGSYSVRIVGTCLPDAASTEAVINVIERPAVTVQPTDKNLKAGDTLVLNSDGYGEQITYQWKKNGTDIAGATQKTYRKTNIVRADSGQYEVVITNPCGTVTSRKAIVRIIPADGPGLPELASASLELGSIPMCARVDTTLVGLLKNAGGSPLSVTSISADPPSLLMAQGTTTPFVLAPGEQSDLQLAVTPTAQGTISGTVTFFTQNGNAVFQVNGVAESGVSTDNDTLMFLEGAVDFSRCFTLALDGRCSTASVSQATLTGVGAGSYSVTGLSLPTPVTPGTPLQICVKTTSASGGDASINVVTSAGTATVYLRRSVFSSVDESEITQIRIQPNPASESVLIQGLPQGASVRIMSLQGAEVNSLTLAGNTNAGELQWDGRDASGVLVSSGTYIVLIEANHSVSAHTLVITR